MSNDFKQLLDETIGDMVADLLYYNRKEDETLKVGDIEAAIKSGLITKKDIVDMFALELYEALDE